MARLETNRWSAVTGLFGWGLGQVMPEPWTALGWAVLGGAGLWGVYAAWRDGQVTDEQREFKIRLREGVRILGAVVTRAENIKNRSPLRAYGFASDSNTLNASHYTPEHSRHMDDFKNQVERWRDWVGAKVLPPIFTAEAAPHILNSEDENRLDPQLETARRMLEKPHRWISGWSDFEK